MRALPDEYLEELFSELEKCAERYGVARAARIGLEENRKMTKNELMLVAEADEIRTITKQERFAYTHPTYKTVVEALKKAIKEEVAAEYACKLIEMKFEGWRSIGANQRAATRP